MHVKQYIYQGGDQGGGGGDDSDGDDDDDDAGSSRKKGNRKITVQVKVMGKPREFFEYAARALGPYFNHLWRKRHQERIINLMQDEALRENELFLQADFAMKYSHNHRDALQSEWFLVWMSTILMIVVCIREDGVVKYHMHVVLSDDKKQSNFFVQKAFELIIRYYQGTNPAPFKNYERPLPDLKLVRIVSDGCKGQFKNKYEFDACSRMPDVLLSPVGWLYGSMFASLMLLHCFCIIDRHSLRFFFLQSGERGPQAQHHFSAECHGKDLPDACNAIIKQTFKRAEWYGEAYFPNTESLYEYCLETLENRSDEEIAGRTIARKLFWYIPQGEVDHAPLYDVSDVPGSASNFSFIPSARVGEAGVVNMRVASCVCEPCEDGRPEDCLYTSSIPPPVRVLVSRTQSNTAQRLDLRSQLVELGMKELKKKKIGDPLIIYIGNESRRAELGGVGRWFIAELLTGLVTPNSKSSSRGIRQVGVIFPKEKQKERIFEFEHTLDLCKDEDGNFTEMCCCGPAAGCYDKRHVQYVPITSIRQSPEGVDHSQWFAQDQCTMDSTERISSRTRNRRREMKEQGKGQKVIPLIAIVAPGLEQHVLTELAYWDRIFMDDRNLLEQLSY